MPNNLPYTITVTFSDWHDAKTHKSAQAWTNMVNALDHTNWDYVDQFLYKNWGAQAQINFDNQSINIKFPNQSQQLAWQMTYT